MEMVQANTQIKMLSYHALRYLGLPKKEAPRQARAPSHPRSGVGGVKIACVVRYRLFWYPIYHLLRLCRNNSGLIWYWGGVMTYTDDQIKPQLQLSFIFLHFFIGLVIAVDQAITQQFQRGPTAVGAVIYAYLCANKLKPVYFQRANWCISKEEPSRLPAFTRCENFSVFGKGRSAKAQSNADN